MQPDIIVEQTLGAYLFISETDAGRAWLTRRIAKPEWDWHARLLCVEDERDLRNPIDDAVADGLDVME